MAPSSLGELVSQTNNYLLADQETQRPLVLSSKTDRPAQVSRPVWVDEFNNETEETWAGQDQYDASAVTQAAVTDPAHDDENGKGRRFSRLTGWFSRSREAEDDDASHELFVEEYYKQKRSQRTRRQGPDSAGAPYLFAVVIFVAFAGYVSVTQEGDTSAEKLMSFFQSDGSCLFGTSDPSTSVSVNCTRPIDVQEIDVDSEERILQMHDDDQINKGSN